MSDFCHLHCHTQYSLLDGAAGIDTLLGRAKEKGIPSVAITDHGNLYGVPEFYTTAKKKGVHPIIGCEFYVTPSGHTDKSDRTRYHQVLLAKNQTGYENLMKLSSLSFTEGFYYKPRIDRDLLREPAVGGVILFVSLVMFLAVIVRSWVGGERVAKPVDDYIPPALSGPEHSPAILDNMKLWVGLAILLVIFAYTFPLAEMVMDGLFSPGAPPSPV